MKRFPIILTPDELFATLTIWKDGPVNNFLAMFTTNRQFVFGAASIDEVNGQSSIVMTKIVNTYDLFVDPEARPPVALVSFSRAEVAASFQGATADLQQPGFIGERYDQSLSIVLRDKEIASIMMYRASQFKR